MKTKSNRTLRNILSIALCLALVMSYVPMVGVTAKALSDGVTNASIYDGDRDGRYEIGSSEQLTVFANLVNGGNTTLNVELVSDVVFDGETPWVPIGSIYDPFEGLFDGQFYTISGLYINDTTMKDVGLFDTIAASGRVKNVGVINSKFITARSGDGYSAGGIAVLNRGRIEQCYVENTTIQANGAGGIVSVNQGYINNCYTDATIKGNFAGGIADSNFGCIYASIGTSSVTGDTLRGSLVATNYERNAESTGSGYSLISSYGVSGDAFGKFYGSKDDVSGAVSSSKMASGEIAYDLQSCSDAWGQELGVDEHPVFGAPKVYYSQSANSYSNYEPAVYNDSGIYEIAKADNLMWFAEQMNKGNLGSSANAILTADIDLTGYSWKPIGNASTKYKGVFDGQGHTISSFNMTITGAGNWGLFGYATSEGTEIKNFSISGNVTTALTSNVDVQYGVVGQADGGAEIRNVHSSVNLTSGDSYQKKFFGGIVGRTGNITVDMCSFSGKLSLGSNTLDCAGGVVGYVYNGKTAKITNCGFYGSIESTYSGGNVGGILGYYNGENAKALTISNCLSIGTVPSSRGAVIGTIKNYGSTKAGTNNYYISDLTHSNTNVTAISVTSAQVESGELVEDLGASWGQNIDNKQVVEGYPVPAGSAVYPVKRCDGLTTAYSNTAEILVHVPASEATCSSKAVCSICGEGYGDYLEHTFNDDSNGFCLVCGGYEPAARNSDGVYEISNAGQLYWFAALVNGDTSAVPEIVAENDADAILMNDIKVNSNVLAEMAKDTPDTTDFKKWVTIGNAYTRYEGTFDGNNHVISGLFYDDKSYGNRSGVFGRIYEGAVKNLGIVDCFFRDYYTGAISPAASYSEITNCYSISTVFGTTETGGLIGSAYECEVRNCYNSGRVNGNTYVGGLIGRAEHTTVENCYNTGRVAGSNAVGGVIGLAKYSTVVKNIYNSGVVTGEKQSGVISQLLAESQALNCYYLEGTAENGIYESEVDAEVVCASAEEFASGEVAYLLQSGNTEQVWGQDNNQSGATPVFDSTGLYKAVEIGETGNYSVSNVGDANGDGTVDANDYQALVNVALSDKHEQVRAAEYDDIIRYDLNGDGYVDALDVSLMHLVINGFKTVDVYTVGDIDRNGVAFEEADIKVIKHIIENVQKLTTYEKYAADINGDGKVNENDLAVLNEEYSEIEALTCEDNYTLRHIWTDDLSACACFATCTVCRNTVAIELASTKKEIIESSCEHNNKVKYSVTYRQQLLTPAEKIVVNENHYSSVEKSGISVKCSVCEEEIGFVGISVASKAYDGTPVEITVMKRGILENEDIEISYEGHTGNQVPVEPGNYKATISYDGVTFSEEFSIGPQGSGDEA